LQDVDVCQVSVGATEVVITTSDEIKVDDVDLEGSKGYIDDDGGQLNEIAVIYTPKDQDDDVYLAKGQAFTDPIFGSWKIAYGGVVADYETYSIKTSGDSDATLKFINNDGKEVEIWVEQEPGSGGKDSAQSTILNLAGFKIRAETASGDKGDRADPFSVQVNEGNVSLLVNPMWNHTYIEEFRDFPFGMYKDQVDASSGAFNKLLSRKIACRVT
jgi:predicted phage terminase large subunit-like protein